MFPHISLNKQFEFAGIRIEEIQKELNQEQLKVERNYFVKVMQSGLTCFAFCTKCILCFIFSVCCLLQMFQELFVLDV